MKILYYSGHPNLNLSDIAGYATHMREMITAFEKLGHEVVPFIAGGTEKKPGGNGVVPQGGIKSKIKKFIPRVLWQSAKDFKILQFDEYQFSELQTEIEKVQPDLIYERANYMQISGIKLAKAAGIPHILEMNAPYVEEKVGLEGKSFYLNKAKKHEKYQLENTDKTIVVSSALQDYFEKRHHLQGQNKVAWLPNAVNLDKLQVTTKYQQTWIKKLKLNTSHTVIGFVGSILKWHGVDQLLAAFCKLAETNSQISLLIVGSGELLPELKNIVENNAARDRIFFTGNQPYLEVPNLISLMDITVMPNSNWYGSPVKIFEYGALGKTIIAPNYIPLTDVITHNQNGFLFPANENKLEQCLADALSNPTDSKRVATNFQHEVVNKYLWEHNAQAVIEIVEGL